MEEKNQMLSVIDEYISQFTPDIQEKLQALRTVIKEAAPAATEKISYQMPTFYLHGNLVHFAVQKKHIGFYPAPSGISNFEALLNEYKSSKGAVQFPLDQPLPLKTIQKIVQFRVEENIQKHQTKQKKSK
ncbi:hypothetical protein HHO41_03145 [Bacillus sp. DNRA2]|uniref:iron chaperone n=1 Tax=Bacillus sp. DNRA2 TaxID=2723053 RepID=UPI00145EFA19|nr:DUF1801 domain-containing protein [Bacillus sp. DNRA2]NMD69270.1 hypothetical protein [Bacillus sp. DNRA2]